MMRRNLLLSPDTGGLPNIYSPVEYLESTNGSYFDLPQIQVTTGQVVSSSIKFQYMGSLTNNIWISGDGNSGFGVQYEYGYYSGNWYWRTRGTSSDNVVPGVTNKNSIIEVYYWNFEATRNGNLKFRLFQRNGFSPMTDNRKIWYTKLSIDGNLLHDLIPCIRLSDNIPGMYDLITQTFFTNEGSGNFITP